jgi:asparagine synthase (glutamine-hydrolysing)
MMRLGAAERTMIWTPAMFVSQRRAPRPVLHEQLRARVDQVVGAHARRSGAIVAEVSGGLDSAIVAGALQAASAGKVAQWVNFHTPDPEGDERRFARAVAARLAIPLVEAAKTELELTEAHLAVVGAGLRPGVAAIDYQYDEDNVARCAAVGADTLITGQGGDAVFLQTQTALMGADALRAGLGGRALFRVFRDVAAHRRASVWSVARRGFAASFSRATPWRAPAYLAKPLRALASPAHPWLADLAAVAPAKRLQIHALTAAQLFHGHSRRGEAADLIHPLLSQPLVEFVLSVPSFDLALGANDRALAREAFADRLPGEVVRRRSKAELGAYYGRMLSRSLWLVRPYLLDGLLAGAGLVDRPFLEQALTAESLLWRELTPSLFELLAVEAWARNWDRLAAGRRG